MDFACIFAFASALFATAIAAVMAWSARRSIAHWSIAAGMAALAAESVCSGFAADALLPDEIVYWQSWSIVALAFVPATWLLFSLSYARGNYREFISRWRFSLAAALLIPVGLAIFFRGALLVSAHKLKQDQTWTLGIGLPAFAIHLIFLLTAVVILMNFERTFRASVGTMRWRIKPMLLGLGLLFAARGYTSSQILLFHGINLSLQSVNSVALLLACVLIIRSLSRSGNFQVAVYPSHSILHGSFTMILAGIYLLLVGGLARLVTHLGGGNAFALGALVVLIALLGLTTLLLSEKVRLHTKRFVSRHFQRPQYDYRSVWRTFTEGTARRLEPAELCETIAKLLSQVFQALSVTVWLVDSQKDKLVFTTSTSISGSNSTALTLDPADMSQVMLALRNHPDPLDIDASREVWAILLRRLHPDEFRKGGNRICVPLVSAGELLGVMTLGDRVGGISYSLQDFDLLKSVGDQAATSLLNIQLSQRLAQGKQLEAFQAMSAFFVHDLKNTASTLSLMLQNLPIHFNDPAFREDALRGVSKTVTHINDLISRLGLLRQELTIRATESDLNDLVSAVLNDTESLDQKSGSSIELVKNLRPLPKLQVDRAQIQNVLSNLVLNARDALTSGGQIKVETSQRNGWAILGVSDNGCGMTPEFIQRCLFRPFQTTKKKGLGIGMFQARIIVEAHHGRIEVESAPGKGTSFRVLLPVHSSVSQ
jgi:putative PEP-CTERM system histidine kinase